MIALQTVTKRYGAKTALNAVSLSIPSGQVLGLLGRNGAGKTTLLNILTGYIAPTEGRVQLGGHWMDEQPMAAKALLGFLPEKLPLYDEMTVREYLTFVCRLRRVPVGTVSEHARQAAHLSGAVAVWERRIGNLSKGYRQRVGMAQALCGDPAILVLDEPTSGLDPRQTVEFREMLQSVSRDRTVVFSSHILSEVQAACDRVVILHDGKVVCDRSLHEKNNAQTLLLEVPCGDSAILPALRGLPSVLRVMPHAAGRREDVCAFTLECLPGPAVYRELMTLLSAMNTPIRSLQNTGESLEEIFLRCTGT